MSIRLRLARLEATTGETEETVLITTGVPSDDRDDGTAPTVARVGGDWISRGPEEPAPDSPARVAAHRPRRTP